MNSHQDIIEKLNAFGKMQKPFIFFIDFEMEKPRLFSLEELEQEEIQIHFPTFQKSKIEYDATKIELQKTPITLQELMWSHSLSGLPVRRSPSIHCRPEAIPAIPSRSLQHRQHR